MGVDGGVGSRASDLAPSVLLFSGPARRKIPTGPAASSEGQASPERWRETVFFPNSAPQVRYRPVDLALSGTPCHREPRGPLLRPSPRSHSAPAAHGKHGVTILSEGALAHPLDDRGGIDRVTNDAIEGREAAIGLPPPLRGSPTTTTHTHVHPKPPNTHTPLTYPPRPSSNERCLLPSVPRRSRQSLPPRCRRRSPPARPSQPKAEVRIGREPEQRSAVIFLLSRTPNGFPFCLL